MKGTIIITLFMIAAFGINAQTDELNALCDIVRSLQTGGEPAYKSAIAKLSGDHLWTPMDELGIDKTAECKASERVLGFKLNSILTNAENQQRYQTTTGNHLNGADSRYNYSLFEKTLKAGKEVTYSLPERWGDQIFIIIPYSGSNTSIAANITCGTTAFKQSDLGNGTLKFEGKAQKGNPVDIKIKNDSNSSVSYVIINYNSRK